MIDVWKLERLRHPNFEQFEERKKKRNPEIIAIST